MYFEGIGATKRTDTLFKGGAYPSHCKHHTPLIDLMNFDIVRDVITSDPLHLFYLGIMRKLLIGWMSGKFGKHKKWTPLQKQQISKFLKESQLPSEIHRKMRGLKYLPFSKGSEFRSFLRYIGVVVLKNNLPIENYNHFMLLFCAVTFLSSPIYKNYWRYAGELLNKFVMDFDKIYDKSLVSSNVHILEHVFDDVDRFGDLETISADIFENELQKMKNGLRHGTRSLEQIINRLAETEEIKTAQEIIEPSFPKISARGNSVRFYITPDFVLKPTDRDQWFMLKDNTVVKYKSATYESGEFVLYGCQFLKQRESFVNPCSSYMLHITTGDLIYLSSDCIKVSLSEVLCKVCAVVLESDSYMFIPLLHTFIQ